MTGFLCGALIPTATPKLTKKVHLFIC